MRNHAHAHACVQAHVHTVVQSIVWLMRCDIVDNDDFEFQLAIAAHLHTAHQRKA